MNENDMAKLASHARRVGLCNTLADEARISYDWSVDTAETGRLVAAQFFRNDAAYLYGRAITERLRLVAELPGSYPDG